MLDALHDCKREQQSQVEEPAGQSQQIPIGGLPIQLQESQSGQHQQLPIEEPPVQLQESQSGEHQQLMDTSREGIYTKPRLMLSELYFFYSSE